MIRSEARSISRWASSEKVRQYISRGDIISPSAGSAPEQVPPASISASAGRGRPSMRPASATEMVETFVIGSNNANDETIGRVASFGQPSNKGRSHKYN